MMSMLRRGGGVATFAGLGGAAVPLAIVVHVVAELVATGGPPDLAFVFRHAYLVPVFAVAMIAFAATLGIGAGSREFVRRCALARAALARAGAVPGIGALFIANVVFFAITQGVEGVPIAAGSLVAGMLTAALGSLIAAIVVFILGRAVGATVTHLIALTIRAAGAAPLRHRRSRVPRPRATRRTYTLFMPNRPPPAFSR